MDGRMGAGYWLYLLQVLRQDGHAAFLHEAPPVPPRLEAPSAPVLPKVLRGEIPRSDVRATWSVKGLIESNLVLSFLSAQRSTRRWTRKRF